MKADGSTSWTCTEAYSSQDCPVLLSFCIVNTNGRDHLIRCLDAIRRTVPPGCKHEVLVLDNATQDGSVEAVRRRPEDVDEPRGLSDGRAALPVSAEGRGGWGCPSGMSGTSTRSG